MNGEQRRPTIDPTEENSDSIATYRERFANATASAESSRQAAIELVARSARDHLDQAGGALFDLSAVSLAPANPTAPSAGSPERSFAQAQEIMAATQLSIERAIADLATGLTHEPTGISEAQITAEVADDPAAASDALMQHATEALSAALQTLLDVANQSGESDEQR